MSLRVWLAGIMLAWISSAAIEAVARELSPAEIVAKADAARAPSGDVSYVCDVQDLDDGSTVHKMVVKVFSYHEKDKTMFETVYPSREKGRKLLMNGMGAWYTTPDVKRPVRVSLQQRLTGQVANGDIACTNFAGDYDATLEGHESVGGKDTYRLTLRAKRKDVTYSQIDYWVSSKEFLPVKAVFYAVSGKILKKSDYSGVKNIFGKPCITKVEFTDAIKKSSVSVIVCKNHQRAHLNATFFSKEGFDD